MFHEVGTVLHDPCGHTGLLTLLHKREGIGVTSPCREVFVQQLTMLIARCLGGKDILRRPIRLPHELVKRLPLGFVHTSNGDPAFTDLASRCFVGAGFLSLIGASVATVWRYRIVGQVVTHRTSLCTVRRQIE